MKRATCLLISAVFQMPALAVESCANERYFAVTDEQEINPLSKPSKEFLRMLRSARSGDAVAQRSLAVSYETGYLVSKCREAARYWYHQAAKRQDKLAVAWVERSLAVTQALNGPEYIQWVDQATKSTLVACADPRLPAGRYFQYGMTDGCQNIVEAPKSKINLGTRNSDRERNTRGVHKQVAASETDDVPEVQPLQIMAPHSLHPMQSVQHPAPQTLQKMNPGAINPFTHEYYAPAGDGYIGTRDGTFYAPAGPNSVFDTRTGAFIPLF